MRVERRFLQPEWMLNCITVDIMLSFNIVTFVNTFTVKQYIGLSWDAALDAHILDGCIMHKENILARKY